MKAEEHSEMSTCICGAELLQHNGPGRQSLYCSESCKQKAKRVRAKVNKAQTVTRFDASLLDQVTTGNCQELAKRLPDESIDLIFTDPLYHERHIPLYGWLAKEAARVLKPGGFLLAYAGGMYKDQVMTHLGQHLSYFWDYTLVMGDSTVVWPRRTIAKAKSLLAYSKGEEARPRSNVMGLWAGGRRDKRYHQFGQDVDTARYYIDCFSKKGDIILEPFTGGGTTCVACKLIRRHFIGFEIDATTAEKARTRLAIIQMPLIELDASQLAFEVDAKDAV